MFKLLLLELGVVAAVNVGPGLLLLLGFAAALLAEFRVISTLVFPQQLRTCGGEATVFVCALS